MVIQTGSRTVYAQGLVEEGCKQEKEAVPIHHLPMVERTAVDWAPKSLPGNATIRGVQVKWRNNDR